MTKITSILNLLTVIGNVLLFQQIGTLASKKMKDFPEDNNVNSIPDVEGTSLLSEFLHPPSNDKSSIRYYLFTPKNSKQGCLLEETQSSLDRCQLDPNLKTIFIINGYLQKWPSHGVYFAIKDKLLQIGSYNVILLDWQKYSGPPYTRAVVNVKIVGSKVGEMINFLKEKAGLNPNDVHLIGHSLGAHLAGNAGRKVSNLGRITGLDPAGPLFVGSPIRLSSQDANFVQVIHTSSFEKDLQYGLLSPSGHMDFYVNGGITQPNCYYGAEYPADDGTFEKDTNKNLDLLCNHQLSVYYFLEGINSTDCYFYGTLCKSYGDFVSGKCVDNNSVVAEMGFRGTKLPYLPQNSKFYLRTRDHGPWCLKDGFVPGNFPDMS